MALNAAVMQGSTKTKLQYKVLHTYVFIRHTAAVLCLQTR